jgi:hypothetical protein
MIEGRCRSEFTSHSNDSDDLLNLILEEDSAMMMKRKMFAAVLMLTVIILLLIACGSSDEKEGGAGSSVPSNLSANILFRDEVEITWTASTDSKSVTGYKLYRDGTIVSQVPGPSAVDAGLSANTVYSFRVTALNAEGNESATSTSLPVRTLRYSTYLSTTGLNVARAVAMDTLGNVYITGTTEGILGENLASNLGGLDVFVAKFNFFQELEWAVQYGTSFDDIGQAIAVSGNNVYVAGQTRGVMGTQPGAALQGGSDAFAMRLDALDGTIQGDIVQFGTPQDDGIAAATVSGGTLVVAGFTKGNLYAMNEGLSDIIVARFASTLATSPVWGRQIGSSGNDQASAIAADSAGNIFIAGSFSNQNVYVTRFDSAGTQGNTWVTSSGQTGEATGIAVDDTGNNVYVAGTTPSSFQGNSLGDNDIFVMKLNALLPSAPNVAWSTQLGSAGNDQAVAVALKSATELLVAGTTSGNFYAPNRGGTDFFITAVDAVSGNTLSGWGQQYGTTVDDAVFGLVYDRGRNAGFLTGYIKRGSTASDATIWHLDQNGILQ